MPIALIAIATFLVVTSVVLSFGYALKGESVVTQRVRLLVDDPARPAPQAVKRSGPLSRMLAAIGNGLGGERSISHRMSVAGFRAPNSASLFLGARTLVSVGPALLVLVPAVSSGAPLGRALMTAALYWTGGHVLATRWLKRRIQKRVGEINRALPDALDLMVVSLEAGL